MDRIPSEIIVHLARKNLATRVWLFGSAIKGGHFNDIDLAVEGVPPERFFLFVGELISKLPCPVDVIDLDSAPQFRSTVTTEGRLLCDFNDGAN